MAIEAFFISSALVALAEVGDKTQLLSLMLAARYRRPWPIIAGILVATLANHALAAGLGAWVTQWLGPELLRWLLAASFLAMAAWMLVPDKLDEDAAPRRLQHWGVFGLTLAAFFLAEMGDKTQVATVMLAAQHGTHAAGYAAVVAGTTLGMMAANVPVVLAGERLMRWLQTQGYLHLAHTLSAALFVGLALWVLWR
jgi:Ca2+/H+ antiporter, TMEM165/GDT1 family